MSGPVLRAALGVALISSLAALTGCAGRPSAEDYAAYESSLRARGKMRVETVAADAPFDAADLARNYWRVALHREEDSTKPGGDDNLRPTTLKRWFGPLRYELRGSAVTQADRAEVDRLMARIAYLTGLDIAPAREGANFLILITDPAERDQVTAGLEQASPRFARTFDFWRKRRELICVADNIVSPENPDLIIAAMVVIGAETTGFLRRSCLHEEIAQALGPANDHPEVRPSIFNDDGEFALLTRHDEMLLRMHYDPRLEAGMSADDAMPIVRRLARELLPEGKVPDVAAAMAAEEQ